jgi:hypothetical protein
MDEEYTRNVKGFFSTSPTPEQFRTILETEDLTVNLEPVGYFSRAAALYLVLTKIEDGRFMDVFFSFHPDILEYVRGGDYAMHDWIKDGKNEYFVSIFRYYTMDELRRLIDGNIGKIFKSGDQEIFDLLIEKGYLREDNESDLLQLAIHYDNLSVVDILLNKGVKVEPIHFVKAVERKNIDMMHRMMMYGGNVNLADEKGNTPLSTALNTRKADIVKELLNYGVDVNSDIVWSDYSPLMLVIQRETLRPLVKNFIGAGANVNFHSPNDDKTPLALSFIDNEVRKLLIAAGATVKGSPW